MRGIHNSCGLCSIEMQDISVISGEDILLDNVNLPKTFPASPILFTVKLFMKVPITRAGTKRLFSSFDKTVAELSGMILNFPKI